MLLAASDLAERLEFVFHFVQPPERLAKNLDLSTLDLYEAGMDIGVTRDIPLSYQLYQERLLHEYQLWAAEHGLTLIRNTEVRHILERVERLLDLDPIRPDRRRAVLELMRDRGTDREHALHTAASRQGPPPAARALGPALNRAAGDRCG